MVVVLLFTINNYCFIYFFKKTWWGLRLCVLYKYKHSIKGSTYSPYQRRPNSILEVISQQGPVAVQRGDQHQLLYIPSKGSSPFQGNLENGQWQGEKQHYNPLACSSGYSRSGKQGTELGKYQLSIHQS